MVSGCKSYFQKKELELTLELHHMSGESNLHQRRYENLKSSIV